MGPCFRRGDDGVFVHDELLRFRISNSAFNKHSFAISPHDPREFCCEPFALRDQRARGMPGARSARSRACSVVTRALVTTVTPGITRHSPRNGLTVSFALSPVIGLSCHRHLAEMDSAKLDAGVEASGPHDFTVREVGALVSSTARVHRIPPQRS